MDRHICEVWIWNGVHQATGYSAEHKHFSPIFVDFTMQMLYLAWNSEWPITFKR